MLTGAGEKAFCAGGDLKASFAGEHVVPTSPSELERHARGEADGILGPSRWTDLYKPTIAAVNGLAYAGGLEWVCWTDLAVADEHATIGGTCRRWNIGLADGGTQRLPRIVGYRRALELIITGRVIDVAEAERIGLVNEVVPSGGAAGRGRSSSRTGSRRCRSRRSIPTPRRSPAASTGPRRRACGSRPSASTGCSAARRSPRDYGASTSATLRTAAATHRRRRGWLARGTRPERGSRLGPTRGQNAISSLRTTAAAIVVATGPAG